MVTTAKPPRDVLLALARAARAAEVSSLMVSVQLLEDALTATLSMKESKELLTVAQAAARLGVTEGYLYRRAKQYPFTRKISHRVLRFDPVELEAWKTLKRKRS